VTARLARLSGDVLASLTGCLLVALAVGGVGCQGEVGYLRADLGDAGSSATSPSGSSSGEDGGSLDAGGDASGVRPVVFARDIRPILSRSDGPPAGCKRCHYKAESAPQGYEIGGLDLTTLGALRQGGVSSGKSIVIAGDPDGSAIIKKLEGTYARGARMPKDLTPLSREEIGLVRRWIAEGARGSDDE
jgi:hypothetical protein